MKIDMSNNTKAIKELIEEGNIKEKLINSLYQDINLLDNEMKMIQQLK